MKNLEDRPLRCPKCSSEDYQTDVDYSAVAKKGYKERIFWCNDCNYEEVIEEGKRFSIEERNKLINFLGNKMNQEHNKYICINSCYEILVVNGGQEIHLTMHGNPLQQLQDHKAILMILESLEKERKYITEHNNVANALEDLLRELNSPKDFDMALSTTDRAISLSQKLLDGKEALYKLRDAYKNVRR